MTIRSFETTKRGVRNPNGGANVQPESLVVIRNFRDLITADEAQISLMTAGIYALIFTDDSTPLHPDVPAGHGIALAVHRRDVELAESALAAQPYPV